MGVYAAVRREAERGVGAVLRPSTASITGPRRGSDVILTILDRRGAVWSPGPATESGGSTSITVFYYGVRIPFATSLYMYVYFRNIYIIYKYSTS